MLPWYRRADTKTEEANNNNDNNWYTLNGEWSVCIECAVSIGQTKKFLRNVKTIHGRS